MTDNETCTCDFCNPTPSACLICEEVEKPEPTFLEAFTKLTGIEVGYPNKCSEEK